LYVFFLQFWYLSICRFTLQPLHLNFLKALYSSPERPEYP
jgi:hypothetical protein